MALDVDAKRRWRENKIGFVPISSARGVIALLLLGLAVLLALSTPIVVTIDWLQGNETETNEITLELLILNFAFNAIILLLLPVAALAIARPRPAVTIVPATPSPITVPPSAPAKAWTIVDSTTPTASNAVIERLGLQIDRRTWLWALIGVGASLGSLILLGLIVQGLIEIGWLDAETTESPLIPQIQALLTWPLVFLIPLVAAVTEEVFFRGILQPRIGLIASSAFFGIVHLGYGTVLQVVAPFFLGLLFGILFQRTKSLWSAIAAHYTFDFVQLLFLLLTR